MVSGEVGSSRGRRYHRIVLVGGWGETWLYKIVYPPKPGGGVI